MTFLDRVRRVLTDAAPERYPVMIDTALFAVVAVHDDYADLRAGSVSGDDPDGRTIVVTDYIRSMKLAAIGSIQPIEDWRIVRMKAA